MNKDDHDEKSMSSSSHQPFTLTTSNNPNRHSYHHVQNRYNNNNYRHQQQQHPHHHSFNQVINKSDHSSLEHSQSLLGRTNSSKTVGTTLGRQLLASTKPEFPPEFLFTSSSSTSTTPTTDTSMNSHRHPRSHISSSYGGNGRDHPIPPSSLFLSSDYDSRNDKSSNNNKGTSDLVQGLPEFFSGALPNPLCIDSLLDGFSSSRGESSSHHPFISTTSRDTMGLPNSSTYSRTVDHNQTHTIDHHNNNNDSDVHYRIKNRDVVDYRTNTNDTNDNIIASSIIDSTTRRLVVGNSSNTTHQPDRRQTADVTYFYHRHHQQHNEGSTSAASSNSKERLSSTSTPFIPPTNQLYQHRPSQLSDALLLGGSFDSPDANRLAAFISSNSSLLKQAPQQASSASAALEGPSSSSLKSASSSSNNYHYPLSGGRTDQLGLDPTHSPRHHQRDVHHDNLLPSNTNGIPSLTRFLDPSSHGNRQQQQQQSEQQPQSQSRTQPRQQYDESHSSSTYHHHQHPQPVPFFDSNNQPLSAPRASHRSGPHSSRSAAYRNDDDLWDMPPPFQPPISAAVASPPPQHGVDGGFRYYRPESGDSASRPNHLSSSDSTPSSNIPPYNSTSAPTRMTGLAASHSSHIVTNNESPLSSTTTNPPPLSSSCCAPPNSSSTASSYTVTEMLRLSSSWNQQYPQVPSSSHHSVHNNDNHLTTTMSHSVHPVQRLIEPNHHGQFNNGNTHRSQLQPSTGNNGTVSSSSSGLLKSLQRPEIQCPASNGQARYERYVSIKTALAGLSDGRYHKGVVRVSAGRTDEAYITNKTSSDSPDYLVPSRVHRNRSINGDTVVFEILDQSQWVSIDDPFKAIQNALNPELKDTATAVNNKKDDQRPKERPTVRVVHVLEFGGKDRPYVSVLRPNRNTNNKTTTTNRPNGNYNNGSSSGGGPQGLDEDDTPTYRITSQDRYVRATPLDKRIPWILVPVEDVGRFEKMPGVLSANAAYRVQIESWPETSALPVGRIVEFIGNLGEFDTEERVAMVDHDLEDHMAPFSQEVEKEAMEIVENIRLEFNSEVKKRLDLRQSGIRVMTIDPKTARDLDDAIHIRQVDNSVGDAEFEIGVHIADVTHFVKPQSLIDAEARQRCTTVYLPNRNFPMLPRALCDHLCSLNPNEDKLTFSVIFRIKSDGTLSTTPWIGKTIIRSCCRFHYGEVQDALDRFHAAMATNNGANNDNQGPPNPYQVIDALPHPDVYGSHVWKDVAQDLVLLEGITQEIRRKRFERGSLLLHQSRLIANEDFLFNDNESSNTSSSRIDGSLIDDEEVDDSDESSHHLIEELMLMANKIVAEKMAKSSLSDLAVLRFHPNPPSDKIKDLTEYLQTLGLEPDFSTSASAHQFLQSIRQQYGMLAENAIAQLFMQKMKPADYGVGKSLETTQHFALAFDLYTHFTSPIRRYADVMVHRVLSAVLQLGPNETEEHLQLKGIDFVDDAVSLDQQCTSCNETRLNAKYASDECAVAFFCVWLKQRQLLYPTLGTVLNIQDQSIIVYLPKLGTCKRIFYNNVSQQSHTNNNNNNNNNGNGNDVSSTILDQIPSKMLAQIELPTSMSILSATSIEITWNRKDNNNNNTSSSPSLSRVRQIVRSLCPIPIVVATLQKTPVEFGILALPPWDPRYRDCLMNSPLMTKRQKMEAVNALEIGLEKGYVDLPGCRPFGSQSFSFNNDNIPDSSPLPSSHNLYHGANDNNGNNRSPKGAYHHNHPTHQQRSSKRTTTNGVAVDTDAAKRFVGFHTSQRGGTNNRNREHSKTN